MELVLTLALFVGLIVVSRWGAETRPGFVDGSFGRVERWFPHSKTD